MMLARSSPNSVVGRLRSHLSAPLYRNGYALVANSLLTSGLGMVYWVLAARVYPTSVVGVNSAALAAMTLLATVSQLALINALVRFVPTAGKGTVKLVVLSYVVAAGISAVSSLVFVSGIGIWSPALGILKSNPWLIAWFVLSTTAWSVYILQDSVLTGLRQTHWVPIENAAFALVKAALLVALAVALPSLGILFSWTIPIIVLVGVVNTVIFRYFIPKHISAPAASEAGAPSRQIVRYVAADGFASMVWAASINILPLIVLQTLGATANAHFYLSLTIGYTLYLMNRGMGMSLLAEGAREPARLTEYGYRMFIQTARLVVPAALVLVIGAPLLLKLFGSSYSDEGSRLLRLLAISALPDMVTATFISMARVQQRMKAVVIVTVGQALLTLSLGVALMQVLGIDGIGLAWVISATLLATVLLATELSKPWAAHLNAKSLSPLTAVKQAVWWGWHRRRTLQAAVLLMPDVLPHIPPGRTVSPVSALRPQDVFRTASDVEVFPLGHDKEPPVAMLKLPMTALGKESLAQQSAVLNQLRADPRLDGYAPLLPRVIAQGMAGGRPYSVEELLPGIDARKVATDPVRCARFQVAAVQTINDLHRLTACPAVVDEPTLEAWVDEPLALIAQAKARDFSGKRRASLAALRDELRSALDGRAFTLSWVHGDYTPGNILVTPDGGEVTGIIDWAQASARDLPLMDYAHLFLSTRTIVQRQELGDVIVGLLRGGEWSLLERELLRTVDGSLPHDPISVRHLVLLAWLQHVRSLLTKSELYGRHWYWAMKNIDGVLLEV